MRPHPLLAEKFFHVNSLWEDGLAGPQLDLDSNLR